MRAVAVDGKLPVPTMIRGRAGHSKWGVGSSGVTSVDTQSKPLGDNPGNVVIAPVLAKPAKHEDGGYIHSILDWCAAHRCDDPQAPAIDLGNHRHLPPTGLTDRLQPLDSGASDSHKADYPEVD
jgi:hypothetical protein